MQYFDREIGHKFKTSSELNAKSSWRASVYERCIFSLVGKKGVSMKNDYKCKLFGSGTHLSFLNCPVSMQAG